MERQRDKDGYSDIIKAAAHGLHTIVVNGVNAGANKADIIHNIDELVGKIARVTDSNVDRIRADIFDMYTILSPDNAIDVASIFFDGNYPGAIIIEQEKPTRIIH
jgi:hypothetical protein